MADRWLIGKLYLYVARDGIARRGAPSFRSSTIMPCQWVIVGWDNRLLRVMVAVSPREARSVGPGSRPLYAHTLDSFPPPRLTVAGAAARGSPPGVRGGG